MRAVSRHFTRTFFAGIVALLPIGGIVFGAAVAEKAVSQSWLSKQPWYFPGLGILGAVVITYAVGLTVSTIVGRFFWSLVDSVLESLPLLGMLYKTLKQVLGYGEGEDAMFERAVLVPSRNEDGMEIGLVTRTLPPAAEGGEARLVVFVPAAPSPTTGRVAVVEAARAEPLQMTVHEALKFVVAVGKVEEQLV